MGLRQRTWAGCRAGLFALALFAGAPAFAAAPPPQATFATPDEAAQALIDALASNNERRIMTVLGPGGERLASSGDRYADLAARKKFLEMYAARHVLTPSGQDRVEISVGNEEWPLPLPIVRKDGRWQFDSAAGAEEIVNRRIGRNELAAIHVALTYVEAQKEYFARSQQNGGSGEYAQHLVSTEGRHNGLYWPREEGQPDSPLEPLIEQAQEEGYPPGAEIRGKRLPYRGYFFRVLKAQGPDGPGGAKSYMVGGRMTDGFALIAWPADYGNSGVVTFIVGPDGQVYQRDLGERTEERAASLTRFDPNVSWTRVDLQGD
jgi:hypothetical protein